MHIIHLLPAYPQLPVEDYETKYSSRKSVNNVHLPKCGFTVSILSVQALVMFSCESLQFAIDRTVSQSNKAKQILTGKQSQCQENVNKNKKLCNFLKIRNISLKLAKSCPDFLGYRKKKGGESRQRAVDCPCALHTETSLDY